MSSLDGTPESAGPPEPASGDDQRIAPLELLATGLRNRAGSVEQLAHYAGRPSQVIREQLAELEVWGYVSVRGDYITYRDLDHAVSNQTRSQLAELGNAVAEGLGQVTSVLETLPKLLQLWGAGAPEPRGVIRADTFFGPDCVDLLWRSEKSFHRPGRVDLLLPDPTLLQRPGASPELFLGEEHTRVLTPTMLEHGRYSAVSNEVEMRLLSALPTWMLILENDVVAMPVIWGEARPTAVMAVHDTSVVMLAGWMFERLWTSAVTLSPDAPSWDSLMRLLAQGVTVEAASRSLGISARTGRRRLSDALDFYGVDNQVALGVAWAVARPPRPRASHDSASLP